MTEHIGLNQIVILGSRAEVRRRRHISHFPSSPSSHLCGLIDQHELSNIKNRDKKTEKYQYWFRDLQDNTKMYKIFLISVPEGEQEIFEKILDKSFPNIVKNINVEFQKNSANIRHKKTILTNTVDKLLHTKNKKNPERNRTNMTCYTRKHATFQQNLWMTEGSGMTSSEF